MVRKITLSRAVRIMQNLFPEEYNFYPRSWILPDEFQLFVAQVDGALSPRPLNYVMFAIVSREPGPGSCVLGAGAGGPQEAATSRGGVTAVHSGCRQQSRSLES